MNRDGAHSKTFKVLLSLCRRNRDSLKGWVVSMDNKEIVAKEVDLTPDESVSSMGEQIGVSRRRLFRQGVSVVAVTLASRPVLAWHCKSPSVMASEALNPNTSLSKVSGGRRWADETWGLNQWKGNKVRAKDNDGVDEWWEITPPWVALLRKYPLPSGVSNYGKIKLSQLQSMVGGILTLPIGVSGDNKVVAFLNSNEADYKKRVLVAQLNLLTLNGTNAGWKDNDLDNCITLDQLNQMASGSFTFSSAKMWGPSDISNYLVNNWMAVN